MKIKVEKWNCSNLPMHSELPLIHRGVSINSSKVEILFHSEIWGLKAGFGSPGPKRLTKP